MNLCVFVTGDLKQGLKVWGPYPTTAEAYRWNAARGRSGTAFPVHEVPLTFPGNDSSGSVCMGIHPDTGQLYFVGCFDECEYSAHRYAEGRNLIAIDLEYEERDLPTNDGELVTDSRRAA